MSGRIVRGLLLLPVLLLGGCLFPVNEKIDATVCDLASRPRDLQPQFGADQSPLERAPESEKSESREKGKEDKGRKEDVPEKLQRRLTVPRDLMPGAPVPPFPKRKKNTTEKEYYRELYPPLPPVGEDRPFPLGPEGRPLTLADLQKLAAANSPLIKQAVARREEARGNAIQVGLPPNPTFGFEDDTYGTTGGAGYVGFFVDQVIRTANKLQLARASAAADLRTAELDLFRAQTDLATRIRGFYFAVLVAEQSIRLNRALVRFTETVYRVQAEVAGGGFAAPYEPMYLRALTIQARAGLVQARNRRTAAWKQLAAAMGLPGMPATRLAGRIDLPVPAFDHRGVLARVLARHSTVAGADVAVQKARYDLELARRTPIPDVEIRAMFQKDRTGAPFEIAGSLAVSVAVPVWNKNQGGILQAQAALIRANEEAHRVRSDLSSTLADAFERYENNRVLLVYYRDQVLPDLIRVYEQTLIRWLAPNSPLNVSDIALAQQNLATALATYISTLGLLWQAVVDVTDLLQTPDFFGLGGPQHPGHEIPDLDRLMALPCCHPCSPLPNLHHRVLDGDWPAALPPGSLNAPTSESRSPALRKLPPPRPLDSNGKPDDKGKDGERNTFAVPAVDPLLLEPPPPLPARR
jgi:cobalt-zinc-cadmium efflux system outer membrane protein